jgi:vitamin B12 transporter
MRHTLGIAILSASSALAAPAHAQDSDLVVVTATRTPAPLERLPARVETITRADLDALAIVTLPAALGTDAVQAGGTGQQASMFLRGANSKHVLALFDGIRLNDASAPNAQYDFGLDMLGGLERIEVLRGPASALYGSDAIGGVVNMFPRRGGETPLDAFLEVASGSFDTRRLLLGAAGSAADFDYGVSGEWLETDGHDLVPARMATHSGDPDGASVSTLTANLRRDAGAFAFDALLRMRESEAQFDTFSGGAFFGLRADDPDLENEARQTVWRLGAEAETSGALLLRLSGGQVRSERAETDGGLETSSAQSERNFLDAVAQLRSGANALTAGVSFERNRIDTAPQFASPLSAEEDQAAAYVIGQYALSRRISATASARLDDYDSFGLETTYALGVVADFAPLRLFLSHGAAFKAPSLSERFETSLFNLGNPDLRPENSRSWELGVDWSPSESVQAGLSYYRTRIDDLIAYDFSQLRNVNVNRAAIDGVEAYVEASPAPWATVRAAYAWTDAVDRATGVQLQRRPRRAWRFDARLRPAPRLTLAASWSYVGSRVDVTYDDDGAFLEPFGETDAFAIGSLAATVDLTQQVELFARVDNVANEIYEQPAAFAGAPRSASIGLRAKY